MEYEDPYHRQAPWPPRSKVKVARSRDASDRCWLISRERYVLKTPIDRKIARLTSNNACRSPGQRSKVKVTRSTNTETESVSPTKFKVGRRLVHALSTAMASYKGLWSWVIARGWGHTLSAAPGDDHTTCFVLWCFMCCFGVTSK